MVFFRWILPFCAAALFYEAVVQSDIIIGFVAFGVLRSWWKDVLNLHDPKKAVIVNRIARWALLGGIAGQLIVATKIEEYVACAVLFCFVLLWKYGKLPTVWAAVRGVFGKASWSSPERTAAVSESAHSIESGRQPTSPKPLIADAVVVCHNEGPADAEDDSRKGEYRAEAEKMMSDFMVRYRDVRTAQDALMLRLAEFKGDV